jgi:hypothetical protein
MRHCRMSPRQVVHGFLQKLAENPPAGRRANEPRALLPTDPAKALGLVFQSVLRAAPETEGVVIAVPAYLSAAQVEAVLQIASQAGLPLLGSINSPLATALTAHSEQNWFGTCLLVDADDHAVTLATVGGDGGHGQLLDARTMPHLSFAFWRERLLNALADCCILDTRWDPRESPASEQNLFDQLDSVLDAAQFGRLCKLTIQAKQRYQNLVLQPHDPIAYCSALRRELVAEVESLLHAPWPDGGPGAILVTAAAARLPGVVSALQQVTAQWAGTAIRQPPARRSALEDFGNSLLDDTSNESMTVVVLTADAASRGAHGLGASFQRGDILRGHLPAAAPLPLPQPLEAGPARLHYQGQDYVLGMGPFLIGRQPGVDLMFDSEQWPHICGRHCEIIYDRRSHLLCDRSRAGTLVNDQPAINAVQLRPGDWIRLGPQGPLMRFLGQSPDMRTTA